jgi:hypothetical protein
MTDTDLTPRIHEVMDDLVSLAVVRDRLAFKLRVNELLIENPRICEFGCNTMERNPDRHDMTQLWVRKTRMFQTSDRQIERLEKMCAFISEHLPADLNPHGRKLIGSYGFKHVLEKQDWTDDADRYVSNGEGILAMMLCGHKPRWLKDRVSPNCVFSVRKMRYMTLADLAERR